MGMPLDIEDHPNASALVPIEHEVFMPALSITQAVERFNAVVEFVRTVMREGVDYGVIPGTDKHTLLKPGAEKLCTLFGLTSRFQIIRAVEDWTGQEHGGEPFFFYLYRCQLWRGDLIIAEGDGSCNSWEQKYRYREAQRRCPACGQTAIIRGKEEYGGGWLCFRKRGGCGAKFSLDDPVIAAQPAGRVTNENIADQVNTIQKMSQKRALVAATLLAVNGSEFFTQDSEEFMIEPERSGGGPPVVMPPRQQPGDTETAPGAASVSQPGFLERIKQEQWQCTPAQKQMIVNLLAQIIARGAGEQELRQRLASDHAVDSPSALPPSAAPRYIGSLRRVLQSLEA